MKTYLKTHLPKISLILILTLFVSNILTLFIPSLSKIVFLYPTNIDEPWNWYRLITYPLYVGGFITWIHNSLVIFLTGLIIENKIGRKDIIGLILLSSIIGGMVFIIINQDPNFHSPIAAPTMISWGYWSATIIIGLKCWRTLNLFEKILMVLFILSVFSIRNENYGFLLGQITVIIVIMFFALIKYRKSNLIDCEIVDENIPKTESN